MESVVKLLQQEKDNVDIARNLLEVVLNLLDKVPSYLTHLFASQHATTLLSTIIALLNTYDTDYYVRFRCIQLINIMLHHDSNTVQTNILKEGIILSKFVALLNDSHEVIRSRMFLFS